MHENNTHKQTFAASESCLHAVIAGTESRVFAGELHVQSAHESLVPRA